MLADRLEINTLHGRQVVGFLFQDLRGAVIDRDS
jgi:hypothetical protein